LQHRAVALQQHDFLVLLITWYISRQAYQVFIHHRMVARKKGPIKEQLYRVGY